MKKRITKTLLFLLLLFSVLLSACGRKKESGQISEDQQRLIAQEKQYLESFAPSFLEDIARSDESSLSERIREAEKNKDAVSYNGLVNFQNSRERLGEFQSVESSEASQDADGNWTILVNAVFEKRKLLFTLGVDEKMTKLTEMSFLPDYTMAEKLTDAAGNLLVGMGTVFAVLIFIAWVISLFRYVNLAEQNVRERREKRRAIDAPPLARSAVKAPPEPVIPQKESGAEEDDELLQAVIAAAIAAYEEERGEGESGESLHNGLRVRSIRRR
ncbi:oxaloacetate decarboxylase, gamma chain [Oribacterium sp. oral taxon 078 str. F0263]|uniref:OadG family transporter subunit n=1 Tax=Oribacterium sp. oral taxon 078 TaxID=652706 RepID=UPI0003AD9899|nr:OadG family transporter subunit [Oribacterium sp. oral taxon 078]ERL05540.1 oxaloacetate decarboxylase, gamma chain [Oribacterium sp. oral taxon 078 str. F0263]